MKEEDVLIMFPAAKHYEPLPGDDPLLDLLSEFDHLEDHHETVGNPEDWDEDVRIINSDMLNEKSSPQVLMDYLAEQIKTLNDCNARLRYYMDEIELFLPEKR